MILMPLIMVSPFFALLLFYYLPFETALPFYIIILIVAGFYYVVMFRSMRGKAKTGLEAMIGGEALVIEDISPEGKVLFKDEIWTATTRGQDIVKGERVKILETQGLVLVVEGLNEDEEGRGPRTFE
jgi:membrane-bound ClpP family serine protease